MKMPAKILYLQSTSEISGADISLLRLIEKLDAKRFQAYVILPSTGPLLQKYEAAGAKVIVLSEMMKLTSRKSLFYKLAYLLLYPVAIFKMVRIIQTEKIDLVHTNTLHNLHGWLAAFLTRRPHLWHVREIVLQSGFFLSLERFLAAHFATHVIVTSQAVADGFMPDAPKKSPHLLKKISNAIDVEEYSPKNSGLSIFQDLQMDPQTPVVGLVNRLDHWKGIDTFLRAAALCSPKFPKAKFLIVGGEIEGREDYAESLYKLSEDLKLQGIVYFTKWRYKPQDMPRVHAALTLLVLASRWPEPFGLVLLEAMASGKPVVATDQGGPKEICVQGETGILVPPEQPEMMAEAILQILQNPEKAKVMGDAGRKRVEKIYNRAICIQQLQDLYEQVLRSSCAAS